MRTAAARAGRNQSLKESQVDYSTSSNSSLTQIYHLDCRQPCGNKRGRNREEEKPAEGSWRDSTPRSARDAGPKAKKSEKDQIRNGKILHAESLQAHRF